MADHDHDWTITRDVRSSTLPAPARLMMMVLADIAARPGLPRPRPLPGKARLARETGLSVGTVRRYWDVLEAGGWLDRVRDAR